MSTELPVSENAKLGRLLLESKTALIHRWYERWRSEIAPHETVSEVALKDLAPLQLQIIAEALLDGSYHTESPRALWRSNATRLMPEEKILQGVPIEEVVEEYWLLVSTIRDWIEEHGFEVSFGEFTYFYEAIFELVAESVRRYAACQAEQVTRERAEYLAGVAHQMRTPLSVLSIGVSRLQARAGARSDRTLATMQRCLTRLNLQITSVMRLERYKEGELPVRPEPIYPGRLVDQVILDVEDEAARKGIALEVHANRSSQMEADPELTVDALANLVQNAVKYTDEGSVCVEVDQVDDRVRFRVTDTGPGIEDRNREGLFKPVHPQKRGGVGIGLAVASRAVRSQGGDIGVDSERGRGSVFWFSLPKHVSYRE